jgi:hypothetical protein
LGKLRTWWTRADWNKRSGVIAVITVVLTVLGWVIQPLIEKALDDDDTGSFPAAQSQPSPEQGFPSQGSEPSSISPVTTPSEKPVEPVSVEAPVIEENPLGVHGRCTKPQTTSTSIHFRSCLQTDETSVSFMAKLTNAGTRRLDVVVELRWIRANQDWIACPGSEDDWTLSIPPGSSIYTEPAWCSTEHIDADASYQSSVRIKTVGDDQWLAGINSPTLHVYADKPAAQARFTCGRHLLC